MISMSPSTTTLVVVGHHLAGQPRNVDLSDRGGTLAALTETAPAYRLLRVGDGIPGAGAGRGPVRRSRGRGRDLDVPSPALPAILAASSRSVCLGRVTLADGSTEIGFVADTSALSPPRTLDITEFGGLARRISPPRTTPSAVTDLATDRSRFHSCPAHTIGSRTCPTHPPRTTTRQP